MIFDPKDPRYNHCTVKEIEHLKRIMKEKIDLSLNRSLQELEDSYWEYFVRSFWGWLDAKAL